MAANLIRVDTTGCNLDYIVYLSTSSGGYLTVKDSGINPSFFTSNANAIVISTTSGQTLFDGNTREYIRSPKGSLSFTLTNSRWRLLNTVPYTPLGDAVLSNVVTTDLSIFGSFSNYVDFIVPNTMNVFGGFESQPLPTIHSVPVITAMDITSTVAGLGSLGYLSSPGTLESNLVSTVVGLGGYGYISMSQLTSTASGLGSLGYISQATLHSTLGGLGTLGYVSTTSFVSSIRGLSMIYISSSSLPSTVNGLGTVGYISMPQFTSSIIGISSIYASNIYSTITYLGGSNENQPGFYTVTTTGSNGPFASPRGVVRDSVGNIYVADSSNHTIRKIDASGAVTTVAGSTAGFADGSNGQFNSPQGISFDGSNIYVADTGNNRIRMVVPGASSTVSQVMVTTLAGSGVAGCNNGPAASAQFYAPFGVAVDSAGSVYVADTFNNRIRKIDTSSNVTTLAGSTGGFANGQGTSAQFYVPYGIAVDSAGIIYVADTTNFRIRKIDINSNVTTLAGSTRGFADAQGTAAQFDSPSGIAVDSAGFLYVADLINHRIRKIDRSSNVTTLAGSTGGFANGQGTAAQFNQPFGVAVDSAGIIYVSDRLNNVIRKIDISSNVTTLAGSTVGCNDGQGINAQFFFPLGVAIDSVGSVYVADTNNHRIRKIDRSSNVTTLAGSIVGCNNGPGTAAQFNSPFGVAVDSAGIVYVADTNNNLTRKITTESITTTTSLVTTVAGSTAGFADGANGQFNSPQGISITGSNIYVADTGNNRIRLITPGVTTTVSQAMVTTLAGSTVGCNNGPAASAQFYAPRGLVVDSAGIIYVADKGNNRIRKIDISGNVTTLAGSTYGFTNGQGIAAQFGDPYDLAVDSAGIIYVADLYNNRIRKIDRSSNVTTLAGSTQGFADGQGTAAQFYWPIGVAVDSAGIVYVGDGVNSRIRKIDRSSNVTTLAGSTQGFSNAQGTAAQFDGIHGVAVDASGSVYVIDTNNRKIRKIDTSSNVTTLAGSTQGSADGQGTAAQFNNPYGIAVDSAGIVYVGDGFNSRIRKIDINSNVTTLAGSTQGFSNGPAASARFFYPYGVAVDSAGFVYVADMNNNLIRKITTESITTTTSLVTTVAGSNAGFADGANGQFSSPQGISITGSNIYVADTGNHRIRLIAPGTTTTVSQLTLTTLAGSTLGSANAQGIAAQFNSPNGLAFDSSGNVYIADTTNHRIRKIDINSNVTTLAGSTQGFADGQGTAAQFFQPTGLMVDSSGNLYVGDRGNNRIRKIDPSSNVTTVAGSTAGFADGSNGQFNSPQGISFDGSNIYVADTGNNRIRMVVPGASTTVSQVMVTTLAGSTLGSANGQGTSAQFNFPYGVAVDSAGIIYVADTENHRIRKIDTSSNVTTLAGSTQGSANGQGINAQFNTPNGVAVDAAGIVYVADNGNNRIRKIDINSNVTTLAGSTQGFSNGQGTAALFNRPFGIAVDSAGYVYVGDQNNHRIRKIDINSNVTTLAGSTGGFSNAQGTAALFNFPRGVAVDSAGSVYVGDQNNHRIRKIDRNSNVTTLAGSGIQGCNNGQGTAAQFASPDGVTVDSAGIVYVGDSGNNRIRKIDTSSNVTTFAGSTQGCNNGPAASAQFFLPFGVAVDSAGIIYVADYGNNRIRKITTESITTTTSLVTTVAGSNAGFADGSNAQFSSPQGISITGSNIYVADTGNHRIRKIDPSSNVTTVAGSTAGFADGSNGQFSSPQGISITGSNIYVADTGNNRIRMVVPGTTTTVSQLMVTTLAGSTQGFANGQGITSQFFQPSGVAVDSVGIIYVADALNHLIRKIDTSGNATTLAGSTQGFSNGQGTSSKFNTPRGVGVDSLGNVYVADASTVIRKIDINSNVTTFAGSTFGFANGQGTSAQFGSPRGIAVDSAGIVYVADSGNNLIRKIDRNSNVTTLAGDPSTNLVFNVPNGLAVDSTGNVYVADTGNNRIRKVSPTGNVTTLSATGFFFPTTVAVDSAGSVYVADSENHIIRKIDTSSNVTTLAGSTQGFSNGQATAAKFASPYGVAIDSAGIIYVADTNNNRIRKIATESITTTTSLVTTVAGSTAGFANGPVSSALLSSPGGILLDGSNIYVADTGNNRIRKIATESIATTTSVVTTVAGSTAGFADGSNALFSSPQGVSLDGSTLYVADAGNNRIRKIDAGIVTTISGCNAGFSNGPASNALFSSPGGIFVDGTTIYVADTANNRIRKLLYTEGCNSFAVGYVSSQTLIYTIANLTSYTSKEGLQSTTTSLSAMDSSNLLSTVRGLGQYYISTATLTSSISGVRASGESNQAAGYISSLTLNSSIEGLGTLGYISISHYISSFSNLISTGPIGYASTLDGIGSLGFISTATLVSTVEGLGTLGYISSSSPLVSTVQGLGQTYISTPSLVSTMSNYISTMSNYPTSSNQSLIDVGPIVAANKAVSEIFVDEYSTVSTLPIGGSSTDFTLFSGTACVSKSSGIVVSTVAGSTQGSADGQGTAAQFYFPNGVIVDSAGIIYVADQDNNRIRKIDTSSNVTTLAGSSYGFADGQGTAAQFFKPSGIAVDSAGNLYVADSLNFRIRKIDTSSNVTTLAGSIQGFSNAQGSNAQFLNPFGVAVDSAGIVYVADYGSDQIRKIDINSNVTTLAGGGYGYADGQGTAARFSRPYGVALDSAGIIYVADYGNNRIRKIDRNSNVTTLAGSTYGYADGQGTAAKFYPPYGLAVDSAGSVYVSDSTSCVIRKIDTSSNVTTFAGIVGSNGSNNGPATSARFDFPWGVAVDSAGIIYVADAGNDQIRKIVVGSPNIITSNDSYMYFISLTPYPTSSPTQISIASLTNYSNARLFSNTSIYRGITNDSINIYATSGNSILAYSILTLSNTIIANTTNTASFVNGTNAATVTFSSPSGIAIDSTRSNLYVCDTGNNSIRKVQLNPLSVTTIATITSPLGIAVDSYSTYAYVTDTAGNITRVSLLQRNSTTLIVSNLGTMYSITLDPTNTYAYVTRYTANLVTTVNLITRQIKSTGNGEQISMDGTAATPELIARRPSYLNPYGIVYTLGNFLYIVDNSGTRKTTTQGYFSTVTGISSRATATTIAPTTTLTNQITGQCVYLSNTSVTTTPFISLTPTTVNISANLYANTVTAATFTASSGTSASGLGYFFGDGTYVTTISDIRTKENIQPIEHALSTVRSLQAVEYTKVDDPSRRWLGYIAQDVEDSIPEIVTSSGEEEWRSIQYTNLPGLIIEAIKELKQKYERILALVSTAPSVSAPSVSAPSQQ